jgi:hypothetical protein
MKISTVVAIVAVLALFCGAGAALALMSIHEVTFPTPHQAVLLANGVLCIMRRSKDTEHRIRSWWMFIKSSVRPIRKPSSANHVPVKRGKELHGQDRMYVNPNQIVFVEPVGPGSKVAQLIAESH